MSIALFFYTLLGQAYVSEGTSLTTGTYHILVGALLFYVFSIVYGRLYTGMHSFTDCVCGFALGTGIWALNLFYSDTLHAWIRDSDWIGGCALGVPTQKANSI